MPTKRKTRPDAKPPVKRAKRAKRDESGTSNMESDNTPAFTPPPGCTALPLDRIQRVIEPGPVLLVSTGSVTDGSHNIMTLGFHMLLQHSNPTLVAICIGPWDASFRQLRARRQCVLAIPSAEMGADVVDIGNCSQDDLGPGSGSKWDRFGLTPLPAHDVTPPLVSGPNIMANLECEVHDRSLVGRYALWILRVVRAWWDEPRVLTTGRMMHHRGNGVFTVSTGGDGTLLDLHERMTKYSEESGDDE